MMLGTRSFPTQAKGQPKVAVTFIAYSDIVAFTAGKVPKSAVCATALILSPKDLELATCDIGSPRFRDRLDSGRLQPKDNVKSYRLKCDCFIDWVIFGYASLLDERAQDSDGFATYITYSHNCLATGGRSRVHRGDPVLCSGW